MQFQNDDIDDIFRRAAENYPLNTGSSNWDKVNAALHAETPSVSQKKYEFNKRNFLLLLLLLPGIFIANSNYKLRSASAFLKLRTSGNNTSSVHVASSGNPLTGATVKNTEIYNNRIVVNTNSLVQDRIKNHSYKLINKHSDDFLVSNKHLFNRRSDVNDEIADIIFNEKESASLGTTLQQNSRLLFSNPINKLMAFRLPVLLPVNINDIKQSKLNIALPNENLPIKGYRKFKHFYAGLMAGADFSNVKFQKVEHMGLDGGLIFGYKTKKNWSLETGIISSKKYYYTAGAYFNTSKIAVPQYTRINSVSGYCRMYEVPVTVRYNFSPAAKKSWFAAVGVSSYLMKSESYDYRFYNSYTSQVNSANWTYPSNSKSWLSVMYFSGGYSQNVGRQLNFRIEPYLKLPVKGLGVGDLPIISTGIHFTLSRDAF